MICIFSIANINVQIYNSVVILSKKKFHFTLGTSSKKKNPTQLFTIKSNKNNHFSN